jgi:hypothetical protein
MMERNEGQGVMLIMAIMSMLMCVIVCPKMKVMLISMILPR